MKNSTIIYFCIIKQNNFNELSEKYYKNLKNFLRDKKIIDNSIYHNIMANKGNSF